MSKRNQEFIYSELEVDNFKELINYRSESSFNEVAFVEINNKAVDKNYTYGQLKMDIDAFGTVLYDMGIRNKKIILIGENSYKWIVTFFSAINGNNIIIPLDKDISNDEFINKVKGINGDIIIYSYSSKEKIEIIKDRVSNNIDYFICMSELDELFIKGRELINKGNKEFVDYEIDNNKCAVIIFTSGTTAISKGVMLSQFNIAHNACNVSKRLYAGGKTFLVIPLHHSYGLTACIGVAMIYCSTIYINDSIKYFIDNLERVKPHSMFLVPLFVETLYKNIINRKIQKNSLNNLTHIVSGGAALNKEFCEYFEKIGIKLFVGYGITECSPVVSCCSYDKNRYGSVGIPIAECEVKIENRTALGVGEICVKGSNVMLGYYNMPEETLKAVKDGWFATGDLGYIDKEGFIFITGRIKNLIILSNGENVSPEEIESYIAKCELVNEVVVYSDQNVLCAEIYLNETKDKIVTKEKLNIYIKHLNNQLPKYKQVQKIVIRYLAFEKTSLNKIIRKR